MVGGGAAAEDAACAESIGRSKWQWGKSFPKGEAVFCPGALWTQARFMQVDSTGGGVSKSSKGSSSSSLG